LSSTQERVKEELIEKGEVKVRIITKRGIQKGRKETYKKGKIKAKKEIGHLTMTETEVKSETGV
jgi:hypothetical protein